MLLSQNVVYAGFFSMDAPNKTNSNPQEEIPIRDSDFYLIQKHREEAHMLIEEGVKLIKKGEKRKNQSLTIKGKIKKEIGEKQLKSLKEQAENNKKENQNNEW